MLKVKELVVDKTRIEHFNFLLKSLMKDFDEETPLLAPAWHWLFTHETPLNVKLGADGHPKIRPEGVPASFHQRLWASSFISLKKTACLGQTLSVQTVTLPAVLKEGKSGSLAFVKEKMTILDGTSEVLTEERVGVYRPFLHKLKKENPQSNQQLVKNDLSQKIYFSEISLFQYSSLIRVSHRIHYDYIYTTQIEKHPNLVIHGPFLAQILINFALKHHPTFKVASLNVKALKPSFLGSPVILNISYDTERNCLVAWSEDNVNTATMMIELYQS